MGDILAGNLVAKLKADLSEWSSDLSTATKDWDTLLGKVKENERDLKQVGGTLIGVGVAIEASLGLATAAAINFNSGLANVQTLMPKNITRVKELGSAIQDMSISVNKSTADLTQGAYQVVSAFGDTADTIAILEISAKGATAGAATTTDAINLLSAVTKGYGDTSAVAVGHASDLAFQTVKLGQTTFPELAASMGRVVPIAKTMGVTQEELFATMATLTGVTGGAAEVSTQFRGALQALMAPTDATSKLIKSMGFESGEAMVKQMGVKNAVVALVEAAKQTKTPLQDYIGNIEGQTFALTIAGAQSDVYDDKLKQMGKSAGMTSEAFGAVADGVNSAGFASGQAKLAFVAVAQVIGQSLTPVVEAVSDAFRLVATAFLDFARNHPELVQFFVSLTAALGAIAIAIGVLLVGSVSVGALMLALEALGVSISVAGPVGLAILGFVATLALIYTKWDEITAFISATYKTIIQPVFSSIGSLFNTYIVVPASTAFGAVWSYLTPFIDGMIAGFNSIWGIVVQVFNGITATVGTALGWIYGKFQGILKALGLELPAIGDLFDGIKLTGENAASAVSSKWEEFKNAYKTHMGEVKKESEVTAEAQKTANDDVTNNAAVNLNKQTVDQTEFNEITKQAHADAVAVMLTEESGKRDAAREKENEKRLADFAKMEAQYGESLTAEELEHAKVLLMMGEDWEAFVKECVKPTKWELFFSDLERMFNQTTQSLSEDFTYSILHGGLYNSMDLLKTSFSNLFSNILNLATTNLFSGLQTKLTDVFSGMGSAIAGIAGSIGTLGVVAVAGAIVNEVAGAVTPDYEKRRKDRERSGAATREYYTPEGIETELSGSEWSYSRESLYRMQVEIKELATTLANPKVKGMDRKNALDRMTALKAEWEDMTQAAGAGIGYSVLQQLASEKGVSVESIIRNDYGGSINFTELELLGLNSDQYKDTLPVDPFLNNLAGKDDQYKILVPFENPIDGPENVAPVNSQPNLTEAQLTALRKSKTSEVYGRLEEEYGEKLDDDILYQLMENGLARMALSDVSSEGWSDYLFNLLKTMAEPLAGTFHEGGIVPGIVGQEKWIKVLAGEEVVTRSDNRHSTNGGGILVNITGNTISSYLDMQTLGELAAEEIMKQLKLQTKFAV